MWKLTKAKVPWSLFLLCFPSLFLSLQALYTHCLFLHEGWPLCLRDEVVVHLAPLNPLLLRQGDFYLQVESWEEQSVHMTLKCLSSDLREVDKKTIPETSYSLIFTPEWLEAINNDFEGRPLYNCLVASENGITPVPWTRITSPEFVDDRPPIVKVPSSDGDSCPLQGLHLSRPQETYQAGDLGSRGSVAQSWDKDKGKLSGDKYPGLIKVEPTRPGQLAFRTDSKASQSLEGDYVALLGFPQEYKGASPDSEVVAFSVDTQKSQELRPVLGKALPLSGPAGKPPLGRWACEKPAGSGEKPCSGGSRRKARHKASGHTAVRQPQQPHTNIPEKLLDCISDLVEDTEEEPAASKMQRPMGMPEAMVQLRPGPRQAFSPLLSSAGPGSPAAETKTEETTLGHGRASKAENCLNKNTSFHGSPAPGLQFSYLKEQRVPLGTPEKALLQHTRPQKALCPLYSQQPCEANTPGKGKSPHSAGQGPDLYPGAEGSGCEEQGPHCCPSLRGLKTSHYCLAEQHYWGCLGSHSSFGACCVTLARSLASLNLGLFLCWGPTSQRCSDGSKMRLKVSITGREQITLIS